jgi:two-component system, LuxR family, response regulator FixJ
MSGGVIMGGHLAGHEQTDSIEAYQSGCGRFDALLRFEAPRVGTCRRKLMKKQGELSVAGPLVIIVDDDVAVRNSLKFSLEVEGFAVRVYSGGIELLSDTEIPHGGCLVVDQNMPGMNGLDLVAQLRARDVAVPAILITSYPTVALRERAAKAGVAIVEKPFLGTILVDRIRDLFSRHSAVRTN